MSAAIDPVCDARRRRIARRAARELVPGTVVNLGIGIPTLVGDYLPAGVFLQSENGILGLGPAPHPDAADEDLTNAGGGKVTAVAGASFFDSMMSFAMIRGGRIDTAILGALQVDERGNLASWMVPGGRTPGMGGSMDLVVGARRIIVAAEHVAKDGAPRIMTRCSYPLTAAGEVDAIVTDLAVFDVTPDGLVLRAMARDTTMERIRATTQPAFRVAAEMDVFE